MSQTQWAQNATPNIPAWVYPPPLTPSTIMVGAFAATVSAQGTVDLPEQFLNVLLPAGESEIGLYLNRYSNCVEGCGIDFAPFVILHNPIRVPISDGRVSVLSEWASHIGLTDRAIIVGKGRTFQIWEPSAIQNAISAINERQSAT